jgi:hypothetical protein
MQHIPELPLLRGRELVVGDDPVGARFALAGLTW